MKENEKKNKSMKQVYRTSQRTRIRDTRTKGIKGTRMISKKV